MLKEVLFIDFLVDDTGVINKPAPEPRGWGQYLELFVQSTAYKGWLLWGLLGNPWLHPQPVQRTGLGRRNRCFSDKNSNRRMMSLAPITVIKGVVLFQ